VERETTPESAAAHRIADQRTLGRAAQQHFADRTSRSDPDPARSDPVTGDVSREHWIVPVHGLTHADPDGIVQAIARPDGTVILHLTCGDSRARVWFDVSRAAQLSTGIWEAAGASQQLTGYLGDDQPLSLLHGSGVPLVAGRAPHLNVAPRGFGAGTTR
jgi:hypothetical protein